MENFVPLGRVGAPFGILGWNHFVLYADSPKMWLQMPIWWLGDSRNGFKEIAQKKLEMRNKKWIVHIQNAQNRNVATLFEGLLLGAPLCQLPQLGNDEFYWEELVGMQVVLPNKDILGNVAELIESPANAVLVVKNNQKTHLLPFVKSVILSVSRSEKKITAEWDKTW